MSDDELIPVTVQIMDSEYRVACPVAEREALLDAAHYLNEKMLAIRNGGKLLGMERIAVMAALNIAHELLKCRHETAELDDSTGGRIQELLYKVEAALNKPARMDI